jgi:hypothetical protein
MNDLAPILDPTSPPLPRWLAVGAFDPPGGFLAVGPIPEVLAICPSLNLARYRLGFQLEYRLQPLRARRSARRPFAIGIIRTIPPGNGAGALGQENRICSVYLDEG